MAISSHLVSELDQIKHSFKAMDITGYYAAPLVNAKASSTGLSQKVIDKVAVLNHAQRKIDTQLVYFSDNNVRSCFEVFKEGYIASDPFFMEMGNLEVKSRICTRLAPANLKQKQWQSIMYRFGYHSRGASVFHLNSTSALRGVLVFFSDKPPETLSQVFATRQDSFEKATRTLASYLQARLNTQSNPWVSFGAIGKKSHTILLLLARGMDTAEISKTVSLTKRGVDYHIETLKEQLQARNRVQLVVKALAEGIISYPESD